MRLRRSRCLVCYWHDGTFVVHPRPHGTPSPAPPAAAEVLAAFEDWADPRDIARQLRHLPRETVEQAVTVLVRAGALLTRNSPEADLDEKVASRWGPGTAQVPFPGHAASPTQTQTQTPDGGHKALGEAGTGVPNEEGESAWPGAEAHAASGPAGPPLFTGLPDARRLLLPRRPPELRAPLEQVLYAPRGDREFAGAPLPLESLAALLATTFGPVDFIGGRPGARYRRTSPQAGSRQVIDAYAGVLNVTGVHPGWYLYNALQHALELTSKGFTREESAYLCADQDWAAEPAVLVTLVARLERTDPRRPALAYRDCVLDAGHLGQTFTLVATALGLSSAHTGVFRDAMIAARCGLAVERVPLHVLAVGMPRRTPRHPPRADLASFETAVLVAP
ncbi:SagB/ThcOx family dehydrogenase [Streptomyces sp. NPDC002644]